MEQIQVPRLLQVYDPYSAIGVRKDQYFFGPWVPEGFEPDASDKPPWWHYGRIEYFVQCLKDGKPLDPVEIDMKWDGPHCTGVVVIDGHHRICAADIAKVTTLPAQCGGIVEIIDWLSGIHDDFPNF